jgi:Phage integrase family
MSQPARARWRCTRPGTLPGGTAPTHAPSAGPGTTPTGSNGQATPAPATTARPPSGWSTPRQSHDQLRLSGIASWPGAGTPALFLNRRGGRLSTRSVSQLLAGLAARADLVDEAGKPAASAHDIRHTFATSLLRSGAGIVVVAEILGHRRLDTTRLYTRPTAADVEAAVSKLLADQ